MSDRMTGAIVGGLVAGVGLTALLVAGERKSGKPNEIVDLQRAAGRRLNWPVPRDGSLPEPAEQAFAQGGHLLLSAAAGAAYGALTEEDTPVISSGIAFGLAFYASMHWLVGPLLGVKKPEWESEPATIGLHALNHVAFGLVTAAFARWASRR